MHILLKQEISKRDEDMKKYLKMLFVSLYFVNLFIDNALCSRFPVIEVEKNKVDFDKYIEIKTVCDDKTGGLFRHYYQDTSGSDEMFKIRIDKEKALPVLIKYLKDDSIYIKNLAASYVERLSYLEFEDTIKEVLEYLEKQGDKKYTYNGAPWDGIKSTKNILECALYKINFYKIPSYEKKLEILEKEFDNKQKRSDRFNYIWGYYQLGNVGEKVNKENRKKIIKLLEDEKSMSGSSWELEENLARLNALEEGQEGIIKLLKGVKISKGDKEEGNQYLKIWALNMIEELKIVDALPIINKLLGEKIEKAKNGYRVREIMQHKEAAIQSANTSKFKEQYLRDIEKYYNADLINKAVEDELLEMDAPFVKKAREVIKYLESLPKEEKKQ
jgi:hypothetical protein